MGQFAGLRFADHIFFAICDLRLQLFFAGSKLPQIHDFYPYKYTHLKMLSFEFKNNFWILEQFWVTWHFVVKKILTLYVGKENIRGEPVRIWIRNTTCFLVNFRFCGLRHEGNLQICDLRTSTPQKLRTCDCVMSQIICGFAICDLRTNKKFACPSGTIIHFMYRSVPLCTLQFSVDF